VQRIVAAAQKDLLKPLLLVQLLTKLLNKRPKKKYREKILRPAAAAAAGTPLSYCQSAEFQFWPD